MTFSRMITVSVAMLGLSLLVADGQAQRSGTTFTPSIPKTWDDEAIASLEVPLANPIGSPKHVSADYSASNAEACRSFFTASGCRSPLSRTRIASSSCF